MSYIPPQFGQLSVTAQTTDNTPTVIASIPVPQNKGYMVDVYCNAFKSDKTAILGGYVIACFNRATGNVARTDATVSKGLIQDLLSNFSNPQPSIDIKANTSTQAIDIEITGKTSTTIDWKLQVQYLPQ